MKTLLPACCIAFLFTHISVAQTRSPDLSRSIAFNAGFTKHGTGDMRGIMFGFSYEKKFRPQLAWGVELGTTIHDGSYGLLVNYNGQEPVDMSYRFTVAGAQLVGRVGYDFIRSPRIDLGLRLGALVRYQSSSLPNQLSTYFPGPGSQFPFPVYLAVQSEPQRTVSLGAQSQLFLNYNVGRKMFVGASAGLQLDTNGDTMFPQLLVSVGRRF